MKRLHPKPFILVLFGIAFVAFLYNTFPQRFAAEAPLSRDPKDPDQTQSHSEQSPPAGERSDETAPLVKTSPSPVDELSEDEFLQLYRNTDFTQTFATAKLVERLESSWRPEIASYFTRLLDSIGDKDANERGRLIFLANELRSADLLPFWESVLERRPAGFENEAELLRAIEPSLSSMALRNELSTAVRNLGIIAYKDSEALDVLQTYTKNFKPDFENVFIRKDAYYRVREVNPTAAARSLMSLSKNDPLRAELARD